MTKTLTIERLREVLDYDQETGIFTWKVTRGSRKAGQRTPGSLGGDGALYVRVDKVLYKAHRLAWFHVHADWPAEEIDHRNCDPADNRLANLRPADRCGNNHNTRIFSTNTSGFKGVCWNRHYKKWQAVINVRRKVIALGRYDRKEEAAEAYRVASEKYHGEFGRLN